MKLRILIITTFYFALLNFCYGQDAETYYNKGLELALAGNLEEAIKFFDMSIELNPNVYIAWYNRGIAKGKLNLYEEALPDYEQTLKLYPNYKKGYLNRGTTKKHLTDYDGALADYNYAIQLDSNFAEAYYNRGLIYEMLSKKDSACSDFNKAKELGLKVAQKKVDKCKKTIHSTIEIHPILRLTMTADNDKYGFSSENPIKVGIGPDGGPANQEAYLDLLRDKQGKPIKYTRLGSCCPYKSENGINGFALVDIYEINYTDEKGERMKEEVYISFYDYQEPKILFGFKTVGQK